MTLAKDARRMEREQKERERVNKLYEYERSFGENKTLIAGVDEAGRGTLAGPVSVAAVILPVGLFLPKLNDSKKLSPKMRDVLFDEIQEKAICVRHVFVDEKTIDRVNILQATISGMYEVIAKLDPAPQAVLTDAVKLPALTVENLALVKGDALSASIAAASIVAKVLRDRLMTEYDGEYPQYGFAKHKGYGTAEHIAALKKYGACPIHRRSFEPIKSM